MRLITALVFALTATFASAQVTLKMIPPPPDVAAPLSVEDLRAPNIVWVGRLAVVANESSGTPKPLYLRAPDAQPQSAASLPRQ